MALYSREEFCTLTGLASKNLSVYVIRGKLVFSGEFVDTSIDMNAEFLQYRLDHLERKKSGVDVKRGHNINRTETGKLIPAAERPEKIKVETKTKYSKAPKDSTDPKPKKKPVQEPIPDKSPRYAEPNPAVIEANKMKTRLTEAQLEKTEKQSALMDLKVQQQIGKFIPTDLVKMAFKQMGQSFSSAYRVGAENLLEEFVHKYKVSNEDMIRLKDKLVSVINSSHASAIKEAKRSFIRIIETQTKDTDADVEFD